MGGKERRRQAAGMYLERDARKRKRTVRTSQNQNDIRNIIDNVRENG
jgi:hypothetical protein